MAYTPPMPKVSLRDDFPAADRVALIAAVREAVGTRGHVAFGLRASAIVHFPEGRRGREPMTWQTTIADRDVDVLVCDPATLRPLAAAASDDEVRKLLNAAGLPTVDISANTAAELAAKMPG